MAKLTNKDIQRDLDFGQPMDLGLQMEYKPYSLEESNAVEKAIEYKTSRDIIASILPEMLDGEVKRANTTERRHKLDADGKQREYNVVTDADGNEIASFLTDSIDSVILSDDEDFQNQNGFLKDAYKQQLFRRVAKDLNPESGEFYDGIGQGFFASAFNNSQVGKLTKLGLMAAGDDTGGKHTLDDVIVNNLDFKGDNILYNGVKLPLDEDEKRVVNEWFGKKVQYDSDGFWDSFAHTATTFALDLPLFAIGGSGAGAVVGKMLPKAITATDLGGLATKALHSMLTMELASAPSTIVHGIEGGTDALLDDISHNAKFGLMATAFGVAGERVLAPAVSSLLRQPKGLQFNQAMKFLRSNPQVTKQLSTGVTSGMLGYYTSDGSTEDRLATAFTFASYHFANLDAWKSYAKGKTKSVMVDKDSWEVVKQGMKAGKGLEESIEIAGAGGGNYFIEEKGLLKKIDGKAFVTKGEVNVLSEEVIQLDKQNIGDYNYITEAVPFAKKAFFAALKDGKVSETRDRVYQKTFKDLKNPYDKGTIEYQQYEMNKIVGADMLALSLVGDKINGLFKKTQLPKDQVLLDGVIKLANDIGVPIHEVNRLLNNNILQYIADPAKTKEAIADPETAALFEVYSKTLGKEFMTKYRKEVYNGVDKDVVKDKDINVESRRALFESPEAVMKDIIDNKKPKDVSELREFMDEAFRDPTKVPKVEEEKPIESESRRLSESEKRIQEGVEEKLGIAEPKEKAVVKEESKVVEEPAKESEPAKPDPLKEATENVVRLDKELETLIPDAELREEVKVSIGKRSGLSEEVQSKLVERDKANTLKHDLRTPEKTDVDISNVATPENRRKTLSDLKFRTASGIKDITIKEIEGALTKSKSVKEFNDQFKTSDRLSFLSEAADKLGVKIRVEEAGEGKQMAYDPKTNEIIISPSAFKEAVPKAEIERQITHETIHALLESPKAIEGLSPKEIEVRDNKLKEIQKDVLDYWIADEKVLREKLGQEVYDVMNQAITEHPTELVAYGLSNPEFARYLDSLPAKNPVGKVNTIWDQIKSWVRDLGSRVVGVPESKLDEITSVVSEVELPKNLTGAELPEKSGSNLDKSKPLRPLRPSSLNDRTFGIDNTRPDNRRSLERKYSSYFAQKEEQYVDPKKINEIHKDGNEYKEEVKLPSETREIINDKIWKDMEIRKNTIKSPIISKGMNGFTSMLKDGVLYSKLYGGLKKMWTFTEVPSEMAEHVPEFNRVYREGASMTNQTTYELGRIMEHIKGVANFKPLRQMIKSFPEQVDHFLSSFRVYGEMRRRNQIAQMNYEQYAKEFNITGKEKELLDRHAWTQKESNKLNRAKTAEFILEVDNNITRNLDVKELEQLLGKNWKAVSEKMKGNTSVLPAEREKIATFLAEKLYPPSLDNKVYYNSVRPATPDTWNIEVSLPKEVKEANPDLASSIYTYANDRTSANKTMEELKAQGYKGTMYKIGDMIDNKTYWDNLTTRQIMELVNRGDIDPTNEVITRLLEQITTQTKNKLFEPHTYEKDFVEGMHFTALEYESQMGRFVGESVFGSMKPLYFKRMNDRMDMWEAKYNDMVKNPEKHNLSKSELDKMRNEVEYGRGYLNQLKTPERTWVDYVRGAAMAYHVGGIKPSFLILQATQGFQTTVNQAISQMGIHKIGSGGDAVKIFGEASKNAVNVGLALRAVEKGIMDVEGAAKKFNLDPQMLEHMQVMSLMRKIGGVGTEEVFGVGGDTEHYYKGKGEKTFRSMLKAMSVLGMGVERYTRLQSAQTFYEIGKRRGLSGNDLLDYTIHNVDKTMGVWGKGEELRYSTVKHP